MSYTSIGIKKSDTFLDIIRILDKIQYRKTSENLMTSHEVKKALRLYELSEKLGVSVYVEFFSCFSISGYKFSRKCTYMVLNSRGGFISWKEAPERQYGKGDRFVISIINPLEHINDIIKLFPDFKRKDSGADNHLILTGE